MHTSSPHPDGKSLADKLVDLLDYVEQVVRIDERTLLALSEYRLADRKPAIIRPADTRALPGVRHDGQDDGGAVWLVVERLDRIAGPAPPEHLAGWIIPSDDPGRVPETRGQRTVTVDEAGRLARIAGGACAEQFEAIPSDDPDAAPLFALTLDLADQAGTRTEIERWLAAAWAPWSEAEKPRRRTIALYETLYRLLQALEVGGAEAPIELVWGTGMARWRHGGRVLDRPFIERGVDVDLDEGGTIRVRPTAGDATVDLKPYEDLGCAGLPALDALIRREIDRAAADEGVTPFRRESFEPILVAAAARLHPHGQFRPDPGESVTDTDGPVFDASWALFARPRSSHVILADIDRMRAVARDPARTVEGLAARLVSEPSGAVDGCWDPLSPTLGASPAPTAPDGPVSLATDVFFPKPFNDDQVEIVRRLARSDGLVVQGPPGTGKTHTIANLICHAMATGQRVLVVSRGEAALSVLRDHLPDKVRPLAIALLSNERQGLRQVEGAVREIQAVVEGSRPEHRRRAIAMAEAEIVKLRLRIAAIDAELDTLAAAQAARMGPRGETPADVARRLVAERDAHAWMTDRPAAYAAETGLTDADLMALSAARRQIAELLDHRGARLPSPADLPGPDLMAEWHAALVAGAAGARAGLRVAPADCGRALALAAALDGVAGLHDTPEGGSWLRHLDAPEAAGPWAAPLARVCAEWSALEVDLAEATAVDLPAGLLDDAEARAAVRRAAAGERAWPRLALGKAAAKALVAGIRLRGAPVPDGDAAAWTDVERRIALDERRRAIEAQWRALGRDGGAAEPFDTASLAAAAAVGRRLAALREALAGMPDLPATIPPIERLVFDPASAKSLATQLRQGVGSARLDGVRAAVLRVAALFEGADRTSRMAERFFADALGRADLDPVAIASAWRALLGRIEQARTLRGSFADVERLTEALAQAGAPAWAARLRSEAATADADPLVPADWRAAWDHAAAWAHLARTDARARLATLAGQRSEAERNASRLFVELVRERTFYALERRLSPAVKSALVQFVSALARLGKGTGKGAGHQRRAARDAMRRCYEAVPCWIMPTWRVAEQVPADLGAFDLVILDEASQSDVTELPAVLRGRKILVVGDDRQVSPQAPFVSQARIDQLRGRYLRGQPFGSLLEPGESLYTLMQAVFPEQRLMLKEHFRCVEPIIGFSMQFYPEKLLPLRIPSAAERLDPPLVDIVVPHGARDPHRKINRAEAAVIVDEIAGIAATPSLANRSIGVISLIGGEQAELVRAMLAERIGAEPMQRHRILCGDSATFQGNERDVVFLSMVADRSRGTALTMRRYEQRFNVAMSRARDRVVLVRSVERADLNPQDLKARLIAHFENPMPSAAPPSGDALDRCESGFERDVMGRLLALGYRVEPQVGALGFRIDMVVEGNGGRRLAVECDGDSFHGPDVWREDRRRQRVLERVGWRFWRCFASSFYADPDGTLADLVATLDRSGIAPRGEPDGPAGPSPHVEHRVAPPPPAEAGTQGELALGTAPPGDGVEAAPAVRRAGPGDRVVLRFADDRRPLTVTLTDGRDDQGRGRVPIGSSLGRVLTGREEDEEVEVLIDGALRTAMVEQVLTAVSGRDNDAHPPGTGRPDVPP